MNGENACLAMKNPRAPRAPGALDPGLIGLTSFAFASLGAVSGARPLPGPNSFIFAYIFTKKHPHRRSTPPPRGNPVSVTDLHDSVALHQQK